MTVFRARRWLAAAALAVLLGGGLGFCVGRGRIDDHAARNRELVREKLRERLARGDATAETIAVTCWDYYRF